MFSAMSVGQRIMRMTKDLLSLPRIDCQEDRVSGVAGGGHLRLSLVHFYRRFKSLRVGILQVLALLLCVTVIRAEDAGIPPQLKIGSVYEAPLLDSQAYGSAFEALLESYELKVGQTLSPGERGKVAIKVNCRAGRGLSTPLPLLRSAIQALESRGYSRDSILIVDGSAYDLRQAGILPPLSVDASRFEGCPVIALDTHQYFDDDWFYDSPIPPVMQQNLSFFGDRSAMADLVEGAKERKSYLPMPLMFEVDFWIHLAVGVDDPALGVDGVLASATLWNVSNSQRFLVNQATASAAVAEIAAIPELEERMLLHFVSMAPYQFIGGPKFNSLYSRIEPRLLMSSDPVALDRILYDRINADRLLHGFPEILPLPRQMPFAASLGLGEFEPSRIQIEKIKVPEVPRKVVPATDPES